MVLMMSGACCLDVVSSRRRTASAFLSKRIVRKRLLNAGRGGVDRCIEDGTNVVFRKPENSYVNCIFLDEHDTILAADRRGYIDIVRLPRYDGSSIEPRRPLGQALCTNLSAATDGNKFSPDAYYKLYSLQNGKAFAVGLASGNFRVFATEHASLWDSSRLGLKPTLLSQSVPRHVFQGYITQGFKSTGPLRKYWRDDTVSLSHQLQHPANVASRLQEFYKWDDLTFVDQYTASEMTNNPQSQWDFRETSSGSLQAVHIGQYSDMFGLRILDDRTPQSQHDICVDLDMQNGVDITAVCFVNDNCVASSSGCSSSSPHCYSDANTQNREIKLWDIRMIKNGEACSNIVLPSYPRDAAHGMRAKEILLMRDGHSQNRTQWKNSKSSASDATTTSLKDSSPPLVCGLTPLHGGHHLMASARFDHHFLIDCSRPEAEVATVIAANSNLRNPDCTVLSTYAVDKQNGNVAIYEAGAGEMQTITLHAAGIDDVSSDASIGRKRKLSGPTSKLETSIRDCYGLHTELSCLAFNPTGTSLVGASVDGDIFAWRAA